MHPNKIGSIAAASTLMLAIVVACSGDKHEGATCYSPLINGVIAYSPGIDLLVRDARGRGEALGTTVTVYRGADSITTTGTDTLHIRAGFTDPGTFKVRVRRAFYLDAVLPSVVVLPGQCNIITTTVPLTLDLAANAPPVRSIAIFGAEFLYAPAVQLQLSARFDADASVPTAVNWRLSDTTIARIDAAGLVTSKCTIVGGADTVTATATADTTFKAKAVFSVAKVAACP